VNTPSKPLVSLVLPTYKRAHVLPLAIRSILAQTYQNWELIVVNDNSPDNTAEVVASFTDPRIRYVKNEPNLKLPRALNRGFALARGDYLTWTSDDNLLDERAIEEMTAQLQAGGCDLVYADYYHFSEHDENGLPVAPQHVRLPDTLQLENGNHIGACFLYTRALYIAIGDYDPELFLVEDYDYFMRAAKLFQFRHIAEPLYYFRRDDDTLYLSRFAEVKASDVLVRYKHGLLTEDAVIDTLVGLLVRNLEGLENPVLRWTYRVTQRLSFRLSRLHHNFTTHYLRQRLSGPARAILLAYRDGSSNFGTARDALRELVGAIGKIQYVQP
jgi:glycosyltransferase involved in cell wall biosynthesis